MANNMNLPDHTPRDAASPTDLGGLQARLYIADAIAIVLVAIMSMSVLLYVAYGTARDSYRQYLVEKLTAQGEIIQSSMEAFVRPGLPLDHYVGFNRLADPIADETIGITDISAYDKSNRLVFTNKGTVAMPLFSHSAGKIGESNAELREDTTQYQVVLPVRSRFETVGALAISFDKNVVDKHIVERMRWLLAFCSGVTLTLLLVVLAFAPENPARRQRWLNWAFGLAFLAASSAVITGLVNLYAEGSQDKNRALVTSLSQRLSDVVKYKINFSELEGVDTVLSEYRQLNAEVSAIGLTVGGRTIVHTDAGLVGRDWISDAGAYEYTQDLTPPDHPWPVRIHLAVPKTVIYAQVFRSVKNFIALFIASGFFATVFLQIGRTLRDRSLLGEGSPAEQDARALEMVKPLFFVAVFVEHLSYAFLPQFVQAMARAHDMGSGYASLPFLAYYVCFATALMPAGQYESRIGAKPLIVGGVGFAAVGLALMTLAPTFWMVAFARAVSGVGQGMLFIGVQSFILNHSTPDRRTRGASIIVFGFQGGMISGMAIGSLLAGHIGEHGVMSLATILACVAALYALIAVPGGVISVKAETRMTAGQIWRSIGQMVSDAPFMKTMMLIGVPAKAVMTGVVLFALPLLLNSLGFRKEDIGQITMLYAGAVIVSSYYAARIVDVSGDARSVLFWGSTLTAMGLGIIGLGEYPPAWGVLGKSIAQPALIILGVTLVGLAHGLINAPVVTHVTELEISDRLGASSVSATYRFLERMGHAAGPVIIGQALALGGFTSQSFSILAGVILLAGLLFIASARLPGARAFHGEVTQ